MPQSNEGLSPKAIRTVLGKETFLRGTLKFNDFLKINGRFEGKIESSGFLIVEKGAELVAEIKVAVLLAGGVIRGDIEATERIEILPGASVIGNIRSPQLTMAEGTEFLGRCEMLTDVAGLDVFAASVAQLKTSLKHVS